VKEEPDLRGATDADMRAVSPPELAESQPAPPARALPAAAPARAAAPQPAPASTPARLEGAVLNNRYRIESKLGEGGFGSVYRATQINMGRTVAIKLLHPKMARDPQIVGRFKREAQASSALRNPHTVQVFDFDETPDGLMYLAMEMLTGRSLHSVLGDTPRLAPLRVASILDGLAESLSEAHQQGIVHRDIKPENVYLEKVPSPDFVKLLDFGIAKIVSGDGMKGGPALTAAGQTLGTVEYMSPEQLMGQPLDGRSDLYALGVLAYEMLTGQLPCSGKTPALIISAHLKVIPQPPSKLIPDVAVPPALDSLILRLLAKRPDGRPADANAVRQELQPVLRGETSQPIALSPATAPAPGPQRVPVSGVPAGGTPAWNAATISLAGGTVQPAPPPSAAPNSQTAPTVKSKKGQKLPVGVILLLIGVVAAVVGIGAGLLLARGH
jgi:serine/threonine-protein kinase